MNGGLGKSAKLFIVLGCAVATTAIGWFYVKQSSLQADTSTNITETSLTSESPSQAEPIPVISTGRSVGVIDYRLLLIVLDSVLVAMLLIVLLLRVVNKLTESQATINIPGQVNRPAAKGNTKQGPVTVDQLDIDIPL